MTMTKKQYLNLLVNKFHSATMATIGANGHPVTRIIDLMLWDESGVYFLTAKGKSLYTQLMEQKFIALSATAEKRAISLRGKIKNIHSEKLQKKSLYERNLSRRYQNRCLHYGQCKEICPKQAIKKRY